MCMIDMAHGAQRVDFQVGGGGRGQICTCVSVSQVGGSGTLQGVGFSHAKRERNHHEQPFVMLS